MAELYLRVAAGLPRSDSAAVLARRLEVDRAWSYAVSMWDWFVEKHPEGQIIGPDAAYLIAQGAGWPANDCDKFCAAMVAAGFLAPITEGYRVKGWEKWAGFHLHFRSKDKTRKKAERAPDSDGSPSDVPGTSSGQSDGSPKESILNFKSQDLGVGVQGKGSARRRTGLASPYPEGQDPHPLTSAVLAALWDRGIRRASPPAEKSADRVEIAISDATVPVAVDRLAAVYADPQAKDPITYHLDAIRGVAKAGRPDPGQMDYTKRVEL